MVNSEELICATDDLTLRARCRIDRCRYNEVGLYFLKLTGMNTTVQKQN
jgi:hypothetical protein